MIDTALMDAIKSGLKGEMDSITVYSDAAERSTGDIAKFFSELADEEKRHYNWLLQYYRELSGGQTPQANLASAQGPGPIVTESFVKRIGQNQHLVTAIASAVLLELNAAKYYTSAAEKATVPALKEFFKVLAGWEQQHYQDLLKIQDESRSAWFDAQRFEPF